MTEAFPALPPEEAVAYFRAKGLNLTPSFDWHDLWQGDHATAWTVAKSAGFDILNDIYQAVEKVITGQSDWADFQRNLIPTLQAKGWWGRKAVVDPAHPELGPQMAQLGSVRRLRVIFDTNIRMAYAAGRWNQIVRQADLRPYLRYSAVLDDKTRPEHRRWHGTILRWDHPWWGGHFPPNGWFCRCTVVTVDDHDLARYGWTVSPAPPEDPVPPILYENPRTGEVTETPAGIDPGFAYNPGAAALDAHAARAAVAKWTDAPPALTAAAQAASIDFMLPALTKDFGDWVDQYAVQVQAAADAAAKGEAVPPIRKTGDQRVVGALTRPVLDFLASRGIEPQSGAISITDDIVVHMLRTVKTDRGAALTAEELKQLPEILAHPARIVWDQTDPAVLYVFNADHATGKVIVRIDFINKVKRQKAVSNAVRSGGLVQANNLEERLPDGTLRYVEIVP